MQNLKTSWPYSNWLLLVIAGLMACPSAKAMNVKFIVKDHQGTFFEGAIIELIHPDFLASSSNKVAIMDQVDRQFKPFILVISEGDQVVFPNSDSIKHHVYSFSPAKKFELKLYNNQEKPIVQFNQAGIVALGCNIHDWMSGYIYVAQSRLTAKTNQNGVATLPLFQGEFQLKIWHPRFHDADIKKEQTIEINQDSTQFEWLLEKPLHPAWQLEQDEFNDY